MDKKITAKVNYKKLAVLLFPLIYVLSSILYEPYVGYYYDVTLETKVYTIIDVVLSTIIIYSFTKFNFYIDSLKRDMQLLFNMLSSSYTYKIMLFFVLVVLSLKFKDSLSLILSGATRDDMHAENVVDYFTILTGEFFKIMFVACFVFYGKNYKLLLLGLFLCMGISASRNELLFVIFSYLSLLCFFPNYSFRKLIISILFISLLMFIFTLVLQNRGGKGFFLFFMLEKLLAYKSASLHLAPLLVDYIKATESVLVPFFGRLPEFILSKFFVIEHKITAGFLIDYVELGYSKAYGYTLRGNVVYPMWAYWVGVFGPIGVFLKFCYLSFVMYFLMRLRLYFVFIFTMSSVYINFTNTHILISSKGIFALFLLFILDVVFFHILLFKERRMR